MNSARVRNIQRERKIEIESEIDIKALKKRSSNNVGTSNTFVNNIPI